MLAIGIPARNVPRDVGSEGRYVGWGNPKKPHFNDFEICLDSSYITIKHHIYIYEYEYHFMVIGYKQMSSRQNPFLGSCY